MKKNADQNHRVTKIMGCTLHNEGMNNNNDDKLYCVDSSRSQKMCLRSKLIYSELVKLSRAIWSAKNRST